MCYGKFFLSTATNVFNFVDWGLYEDEYAYSIYRAEKRGGITMAAYIFDEISKDTISKIKYTALAASKLDETWLKSSLAIYYYIKVKQLGPVV